jgi:DNA transformation protein and related proteins
MNDLLSLRNLGPASARMLQAAGIANAARLRSMGAVAAYRAVQRCGAAPSLNLLWALEGALTDRDWKTVSREERTALLLALDDATRLGA